jgi:hypothetical protein
LHGQKNHTDVPILVEIFGRRDIITVILIHITVTNFTTTDWRKTMDLRTQRIADSSRRDFIGGSDARIIMGQDGKASIRVHRRLKNPHKRW